MIDKFLDWRWSPFALLWLGGVAVMLATVLVGVAGASWILAIITLAIELVLMIAWSVWAVRYVRSWEGDR